MTLGVIFALNMDFLLRGNGEKQESVASASGRTQQYISKLMDPTQRINPTLRTIEGIAKGLGVPSSELFRIRKEINYEEELRARSLKKAQAG